MEEELQKILFSKGVLFRYRGHKFFIRAVMLAVEDPTRLENLQKNIYAPIAEEFHCTVPCVEKNLRTVRDTFMHNHGSELLCQMGGGRLWADRHPYPGELLEIFTFYFRNKYKN